MLSVLCRINFEGIEPANFSGDLNGKRRGIECGDSRNPAAAFAESVPEGIPVVSEWCKTTETADYDPVVAVVSRTMKCHLEIIPCTDGLSTLIRDTGLTFGRAPSYCKYSLLLYLWHLCVPVEGN